MLKVDTELEDLENLFKALANRKRLEALSILLTEGKANLQSLSDELEIPLKTASRNLAILKKAGFLVARTEKGRVVYEINTSDKNNNIITLLVLVKDATS